MEILKTSETVLCNAEVIHFLREVKNKLPKAGRKHQVYFNKIIKIPYVFNHNNHLQRPAKLDQLL